jgi:hypothetical protein
MTKGLSGSFFAIGYLRYRQYQQPYICYRFANMMNQGGILIADEKPR